MIADLDYQCTNLPRSDYEPGQIYEWTGQDHKPTLLYEPTFWPETVVPRPLMGKPGSMASYTGLISVSDAIEFGLGAKLNGVQPGRLKAGFSRARITHVVFEPQDVILYTVPLGPIREYLSSDELPQARAAAVDGHYVIGEVLEIGRMNLRFYDADKREVRAVALIEGINAEIGEHGARLDIGGSADGGGSDQFQGFLAWSEPRICGFNPYLLEVGESLDGRRTTTIRMPTTRAIRAFGGFVKDSE